MAPMSTNTPNTPTTSTSPTSPPTSSPQRELHIFKLLTDSSQDAKSWLNPSLRVTSRLSLSLPESNVIKAAATANSEQTLEALTDLCPEALKFFDDYMNDLRLKTGQEWDLVWMKVHPAQFMVELVSCEAEKAYQAAQRNEAMKRAMAKLEEMQDKFVNGTARKDSETTR